MKSITKKIIIYSLAGIIQLGLGTAVLEASPRQDNPQYNHQRYENNHQDRGEQQRYENERRDREEWLRKENARHEQEMRRHPRERDQEWHERQRRENERHERAIRDITCKKPGIEHRRFD